MIPSAVFVAAAALQNKFPLQQIFEKSWEHAKEVKTCFVDLGKVYCRVPREKFCGCCGSTVLTDASCWPLCNCIPAQKIVSVSTKVGLITTVQLWCWTPAMVCAVTTPLQSTTRMSLLETTG